MEDGVTDAERLPPPSELINSHVGAVQETAGDSEHANIEKDEKRGGGGLFSNLISNLVPRSVAETGEEEKGDGINKSGEQVKEDEDGKEGGFINHLISNMVSPPNREVGGGKADVENGGGGGGGSLINNFISNIFDQNDHQGDEGLKENSEEEKQSTEEAKGEGGGGGIINNLVSHLPASLSENAAPAADEASMLIHSIVHD